MSKLTLKFHKRISSHYVFLILFGIIFASLGTYLIITSKAATPVSSLEVENGTRAGTAAVINNIAASGGKAIQFGSGSTTTRNKYLWPFATTSIWNMPIGSNAQYQAHAVKDPTDGYWGEAEVIGVPNGSYTNLSLFDNVGWWGSRGAGSSTGLTVPTNYTVTNATANSGSLPNLAGGFVESDGNTIVETSYTEITGGKVLAGDPVRGGENINGDGYSGFQGAHGGSMLSGFGGDIRLGELTGTGPIQHVTKLVIDMAVNGTQSGGGLRWPASAADSYYNSGGPPGYGTIGGGGPLQMGSLLAIPASVNINSLGLTTSYGLKLAQSWQNYGAYVVDDAYDSGAWTASGVAMEAGVSAQVWSTNFENDLHALYAQLALITNNSANSIGGGGNPRVPLAPPIGN